MLLSGEKSKNCTSQPVVLGAEDKFVLKAERGLGEWGGSVDSGLGPPYSLPLKVGLFLVVAVGSRVGFEPALLV